MARKVYFDHNYFILSDYDGDERNEGDEAGAGASGAAAGVGYGGAAARHQGLESDSDIYDSNESVSSSSEEEDSSSSSSTSESEQAEAPAPVQEAPRNPIPIPMGPPSRRRRRRLRRRREQTPFHFTPHQIEAMENLFGQSKYPEVHAREELARTLNVPEDKVKMWFINRRAKERRIQRRVYLENLPPGAEDFIFIADVEEPS
ncbi:homeobox protein Rhox13-like [Mesocricetus auratus]|uniref:Homeobox protein Rhox13-like n=1 Tax=Mesocricetus auratus TaxID=10036 RepID=A0A1U7R8A3_MESAU|nr:homeobox protein Rhox13-like [Mesocricetus auratus]